MRSLFQMSHFYLWGILMLWLSQPVLSIDPTDREKILHDKGIFVETNAELTKYYAENSAVDQNFIEEATEEVTSRVKVFLNIEDEDAYSGGNPYLRHKSHKKSSKKSKSKKSKKKVQKQTDTGSRSNPNCDSASSSGSLDLSNSSDQVRCSADEGEPIIDPGQPSPVDGSIDPPSPSTSSPVAPTTPVVPTAPVVPEDPVTSTAPAVTSTAPAAPTVPITPTAPTPTISPVTEITSGPTTSSPTSAPSIAPSTSSPSAIPSTSAPSTKPSTSEPTISSEPSTSEPPSLEPSLSLLPSRFPSEVPSLSPSTPGPTLAPSTPEPTLAPSTLEPIVSTSSPTASPPQTGLNCPSTAFINEFHYQNLFADVTEFVEIAHPTDYSLAGHIIYFYDATGVVYKQTEDLSTILISLSNEAEGTGFTFSSFTVYTFQSQVQDANAGIALIGPGNAVLDFISYGIQIVATAGPAAGSTSTLIGQTEAANAGPQTSLQLGGTGYQKSDFTWQASQTATPGFINTGQTILCPSGGAVVGVNNRMGVDAAVKQIINTDFIFHKGE